MLYICDSKSILKFLRYERLELFQISRDSFPFKLYSFMGVFVKSVYTWCCERCAGGDHYRCQCS